MLFIQFRLKKENKGSPFEMIEAGWEMEANTRVSYLILFWIPDYHPPGFFSVLCYHTTLLSADIITTFFFSPSCDLLKFVSPLLWGDIRKRECVASSRPRLISHNYNIWMMMMMILICFFFVQSHVHDRLIFFSAYAHTHDLINRKETRAPIGCGVAGLVSE